MIKLMFCSTHEQDMTCIINLNIERIDYEKLYRRDIVWIIVSRIDLRTFNFLNGGCYD